MCVSPVIVSLLCSPLTTLGDHLGNRLMSLADSKTRFSISVGAVQASVLVSDIDLIKQRLDDRTLIDKMRPTFSKGCRSIHGCCRLSFH